MLKVANKVVTGYDGPKIPNEGEVGQVLTMTENGCKWQDNTDLSDYYNKEETYSKEELKELIELAKEWKALKEEMAANPDEIVAFVNGELIPICNINSMILTKPIASTLEINNIEENEE